ncbi:MAG: ATP-dependent metallopeptidase FtsH/Yme1/Tma family protein, partial [Candidatus Binatia bacterium]
MIIALGAIFALQFFLGRPPVEPLTYSQFKALLKKGLITNLVISEPTIRGEIVPGSAKAALPAERYAGLDKEAQAGEKPVPFVVVRVEDSKLIADLESAGIAFKGEVTSEWLSTLLSWV